MGPIAKSVSACLLAASLSLLAAPATAHPHVWIEARSDVVFDDKGMIVALNHEWTMDEAYTETAVDGLDVNHDGIYAPEELAPLTKENIDSLKEYAYFTAMKAGTRRSPSAKSPKRDSYGQQAAQAAFPFAAENTSRSAQAKGVLPRLRSRIFYCDRISRQGSRLGRRRHAGDCHVELQEPVSDQQTADTKAMLATKGVDWQAPPEEDFGAMFAQPVVVLCAGARQQRVERPERPCAGSAAQCRGQGRYHHTLLFWADPAAFILATQQSFYERISGAMSSLRAGPTWASAWMLILLSFGYGVFHAAGPVTARPLSRAGSSPPSSSSSAAY